MVDWKSSVRRFADESSLDQEEAIKAVFDYEKEWMRGKPDDSANLLLDYLSADDAEFKKYVTEIFNSPEYQEKLKKED